LIISTLFQLPIYKSHPHITQGWLSAVEIVAIPTLILLVSTSWTFTASIVQSKAELGVIVKVIVSLLFTIEYIVNHQLAFASSGGLPVTVIFQAVLFLIFTAILTLVESQDENVVVNVAVFHGVCTTHSSVKAHHVPKVHVLALFSNLGSVKSSRPGLNNQSQSTVSI
jgi:hypothetical protein